MPVNDTDHDTANDATDADVVVRPFRRSDRAAVTGLVNDHVAAVVPGVTVSVNAVLSQLEGEPGEFVVDRWVVERTALVAEQRGRVVAAALLLRYGDGADVGEHFRGAGEIRWLLCAVDAPFWPGAQQAGAALAEAAVAQLRAWRVRVAYADGTLPAPGVYGVPENWPHVRQLLGDAGFTGGDRVEVVLLAQVDDLPGPVQDESLELRRTLGINGTRFSAYRGSELVGYVEVATDLDPGSAPGRLSDWADIGNLELPADDAAEAENVATWLLAQVREWLRLAGVRNVLDYACPMEDLALRRRLGFRELTRTVRDLELAMP